MVSRLAGSPHWTDPLVKRVAEAIYDDHGPHTFPREEAVQYGPGLEARRFVAMVQAYNSYQHAPVGTAERSEDVNQ